MLWVLLRVGAGAAHGGGQNLFCTSHSKLASHPEGSRSSWEELQPRAQAQEPDSGVGLLTFRPEGHFSSGLFGSSSSLPFPGCHRWASRNFRDVLIFLLKSLADTEPTQSRMLFLTSAGSSRVSHPGTRACSPAPRQGLGVFKRAVNSSPDACWVGASQPHFSTPFKFR